MNSAQISEQLQSFLVERREQAGLSQKDVASRSDLKNKKGVLDQKAVSRLEKAPLQADYEKLLAYLSATGIEWEEFSDLVESLTGQKVGKDFQFNGAGEISEVVQKGMERVRSARDLLNKNAHTYLTSSQLNENFASAEKYLISIESKPLIAVVGAYDGGKSTLINTVLDENLLPTKFQPTTSVTIIIRHTEDRPDHITGQAAVFGKDFLPHMINSKVQTAKHLIEQGDPSIIRKYGAHDHHAEKDRDQEEANVIFVYADADLLKGVSLMDTPGDMNGDDEQKDSERALAGAEAADGIIYVSSLQGFMAQGDIGLLSNVLRSKPPINGDLPFHHLLFIMSHCHAGISAEQVEEVRHTAFKRQKKKFNDLCFQSWIEDGAVKTAPDTDGMTAHTYPFWRENEEYCNQVFKAIKNLSLYLIHQRVAMVEAKVGAAIGGLRSVLEAEIASLDHKKQSADTRIKEVEKEEARFRTEAKAAARALRELAFECDQYKRESTADLKAYFDQNTSIEGLTAIIKDNYTSKKDAQQEVGDYIGQLLTAKTESVLKRNGRDISKRLDLLLEQWQDIVPGLGDQTAEVGNVQFNNAGFNAQAAFLGGLSGLSSFGAMAFWVSTLGNLGGYILVGKLAGILVSLGLASSVTAVTSFVAAIGGPITLGIAIAATIGLLVYRLVGSSWEEALAKKVSNAIKKQNVWKDMKNTVDQFWDQTKIAMERGIDALIADTEDHIERLKKDAAKDFVHEDLDLCIETLRKAEGLL